MFAVLKMVDQPEYGTNSTYYVDTIQFHFNPKLLNFEEIRTLYLENGLSAAEIAKKYGTVRSVILGILHRMGVRLGRGGRVLNDPENYLCKNPPYGYAVKNKKLVPNKAELKLCRTIVELVGRQNMNTSAASKELVRRGFKNRAGRILWDHKSVKLIYER